MSQGRCGRRAALQTEAQLRGLGGLDESRLGVLVDVILFLVVPVERHPMHGAECLEVRAKTLSIALSNLVTARIGGTVPGGEMWKFLLDEWEVALPRRRLQS